MDRFLKVLLSDFAAPLDPHWLNGNWAALALLLLLAAAWRFVAPRLSAPAMRRTGASAAVVVSLVYFAGILLYLAYPSYVDHEQPTVAAVSWVALHGQPLYPDWRTGETYGQQYGPLLYWANALALWLSPTILATKLSGVVALTAALGLTWRVLRQPHEPLSMSLLTAGVVVLILAPFGAYVYWNRPEPFLLLAAASALAAAVTLRPLSAALVIGLTAGMAFGFKVHGIFYILPSAMAVIGRADAWSPRIRLATAGVVVALVPVILLLVTDPSVATGYPRYLMMVSHHGFSGSLLLANLIFALALNGPLLLVLRWRRPRLEREDRWMLAGQALACSVAIVLGSKFGAGPHHLLPTIPCGFYLARKALCAESRMSTSAAPASAVAGLFWVFFLAYWPGWLWHTGNMALTWRTTPAVQARLTELEALAAAYPGAQVGVAGDPSYADTFLRVVQVVRGGAMHFDVPALMDLVQADVDEGYVNSLITECRVNTWILPRGTPFTMASYYSGKRLLSDDFRTYFSERYAIADREKYYSVWRCLK